MFTGIIEEIGNVEQIAGGVKSCSVTIRAEKIFDDLKPGDSVAVNGVCLTAARINPPEFTADVMAETMRRTNLGKLVKGSNVNLERAVKLGGRLGGHIVLGHIDGCGTVLNMIREENAVWVTIGADSDIIKYIVQKGSVALDGISLTVADIKTDRFSVSIIPHTAQETTLLKRKTGDKINIECDIIGKYTEKFINHSGSGLTMEKLNKYW